ncbi:hypothetical protein ABZ307_06925 [Streptomyces griseorubiginosus]|uniref:hypothetical protein n=1 Tax=Streptomyces griseorubiginosus TaxID=67304 RepID=UPI0033B15304
MSEQTPSQAEGERQDDVPEEPEEEASGRRDAPRTTPSQAEGDDTEDEEPEQGEERAEWESGWSGP